MDFTNCSYLFSWDPQDAKVPIIVVTSFLQKKDKILVLQRARKDLQHNLWGIPGGKLEKGESPVQGLVREIREETSLILDPNAFQLLGTARSNTPCDGEYGLYLYHAYVPDSSSVLVDHREHYSSRWVTLEEFQSLDLLTAQGEAFMLVRDKLCTLLQPSTNQRKSAIC